MTRFLLILFTVVAQLPLPVLRGIGWLIGWGLTIFPNDTLRRSQHHVDLCLPELSQERRRQIARRAVRHLASTHLETLAFWLGSKARLKRILSKIKIDPVFTEAIAQSQGQGVILLSPHLGSFELAGLAISSKTEVSFMYKPQKGDVDQIIRDCRSRMGAKLVPSDMGGVRDLMKALKNQEAIGILPDQDPPLGSGEFAPMFAVPAHTPVLANRLAQRTGLPVFYLYMRREKAPHYFNLIAVPANPAIASKDILEATRALNEGVEALIRECPEQYWWAYDRYRRRPEGEDPQESRRILGE